MVLKQSRVSEKLSVLEFQSILPLKCVLGAAENELEPVQCLAFLSMAITEDPQRRSEKLKQTERSVLAVLCGIIVSPLDPFYFYCSLFFCLFSLALPVLTFCLSLIFYSPHCFFLHAYFSIFSFFFFPSNLILLSSPISGFYFGLSDELLKWYSEKTMENKL